MELEHTIKLGMEYKLNRLVELKDTSEYFGSGKVVVFATPCMILMMEQAAMLAVHNELPSGFTTVGLTVNIEHCAPTPVGEVVNAKAVLKEIDGRRLLFDVEAWNDKEVIGRGTHARFIVYKEKFMKKMNDKFGID